MSNQISPLAYVDPTAKLGDGNQIGPFCFIDKGVEMGDNNVLMNNVSIHYGARIGSGNTFFPGCSISTLPQDLKFKGEDTTAEIGDNNKIRENVTINRGTAAQGKTVVGSNNLLMEGMHVAHDVLIGNGCIIGNSTKLAGEVVVDDNAILSASVLIHQFCRIGGLNIVGLRRRNFSQEIINNIHQAYQIIMQGTGKLVDLLTRVEQEIPMSPEIQYILDFIRSSKRGFIR